MQQAALRLALLLALPALGFAQPSCPPTPAYTHCDLVFELTDAEAAAHPNPYVSVQLQAEFKSPRARTLLLPAFWDGGRRVVLRLTPTQEGEWEARLTSNLQRLNNQSILLTATAATGPGFVAPANVHHWKTSDNQPHLWMGDTHYPLASTEPAVFAKIVESRAKQRFTHLRGLVIGFGDVVKAAFPAPDRPDPAYFQRLDANVLALMRAGITADLVLGPDQNLLATLLPDRAQRERFVRYVCARYAPLNITWQGVQEFEEYRDGRAFLKAMNGLLQRFDAYQHPRSTHTVATSAPLLPDGWMTHVVYQSASVELGVIERQLYAVPAVNAEFGYENSGAGQSHPHHVATDEFRRRLWNSTMNGQYPTYGNTGTYGGRSLALDLKHLDAPGAQQMTVWFEFMAKNRHWELNPYFDVDGGRAVALPGVEYIVYVEKPGPVEVTVEKHGYDVAWMNPATGERLPQKEFKGERFAGEPPDREHDWVLHISREGHKQGLLRSYKFESRAVLTQEVETAPARVPFEVVEPSAAELPVGKPIPFSIKLKRETRGTRSLLLLWTGEATADDQGYRVLATGREGTFTIPPAIARTRPGVLSLRVIAMNAYGKLYAVDKAIPLAP